jgi:hypothetical protein
MARPKKNNADYFSHDNNMRSDTKIQAVRSKFGNDGYAVWNMLLEVLAERDSFRLSIKNATQWEILAGDFRIDTEKLKEIIAYFIKLELIIKDGTNLICPNLSKRLEPLLEIREKKREWRENKEKGVKDGTKEIKDIPNPIRPDLNALKESKVKESKDIHTQSDFVSCDYIGQLRKAKRLDLQIIGFYFEEAKMEFPSKEAAEAELKRWLPIAKTLKEYPNDKLVKAFEKAKIEYPKLWKLSTIAKIIPSVK